MKHLGNKWLPGGCLSQHALGRGGCVSQHALSRVCDSQHALGKGVCIPACTRQGAVCITACTGQGGVCPGDVCTGGVSAWGGGQNHKRPWKHNLAATTLRTVKIHYGKSKHVRVVNSEQLFLKESMTKVDIPDLKFLWNPLSVRDQISVQPE